MILLDRKIYLDFIPVILLFLVFSAEKGCSQTTGEPSLLDAHYWKNQAVHQVLPAWIQNGVDSTDGQFYAFMDRSWNPYRTSHKYPGMVARHLFSFSAAYLLTGDPLLLQKADDIFSYLIKNGWDYKHGGWFYELDRIGQQADTRKDLFMNIYAVAGLSLYYMVTHNREAYSFIDTTRSLMKQYAWDETDRGYFRRLNRRWEVVDSSKVFTPQIAPVSGYQLYLYLATRDRSYLQEARKLISLALSKMTDPKTGWVREKFNPDWSGIKGRKDPEEINIGHNIEVAWLLLRLYQLTDEVGYKEKALALAAQLENHAFMQTGAWLHRLELNNPNNFPENTPWWIQAYGNMLELYLYRITRDERHLQRFEAGAEFWNKAFLDNEYGATILSATLTGDIDRGDKAVRSKTSYHALEHSLLNYLYLSLWVEQSPATLYFRLNGASDNRPLCPLSIEDPGVGISYVRIDGKDHPLEENITQDGCIRLPGGQKGILKIVMEQ